MPARLTRRELLVTGTAVPLLAHCIDSAPRSARHASSPNARPELVQAVASVDGHNAHLHRVFPHVPGDHRDPFVLLDDFAVGPPDGFPEHPHRGFEAFTYMLDGSFHHRDNLGHDSVVASGGVQLFTSGRGARHSEMPGEPRINRGLQLWINLSRAQKQMEPAYAAVNGTEIPEGHRRGATVRTVVGDGSPVRVQTAMRYLDVALEANGAWHEEVPANWKGFVYVVDGHARVGDLALARGDAAIVRPGEVGVRALDDARFVLIAGAPYDEPIWQHGPFVD